MNTRKTRMLITMLLAAGSLLIAAPASAGNKHLGHNPGYHAGHYQSGHAQRGHFKSHRPQRKHHAGKYRGHRKHKALGHRHSKSYPRYRHDKQHRPNVIIIPRGRPHYRHHRSSGFSTITGGIIGGIVGNNLGNGDPVATGIGIMSGAMIGNRMDH